MEEATIQHFILKRDISLRVRPHIKRHLLEVENIFFGVIKRRIFDTRDRLKDLPGG